MSEGQTETRTLPNGMVAENFPIDATPEEIEGFMRYEESRLADGNQSKPEDVSLASGKSALEIEQDKSPEEIVFDITKEDDAKYRHGSEDNRWKEDGINLYLANNGDIIDNFPDWATDEQLEEIATVEAYKRENPQNRGLAGAAADLASGASIGLLADIPGMMFDIGSIVTGEDNPIGGSKWIIDQYRKFGLMKEPGSEYLGTVGRFFGGTVAGTSALLGAAKGSRFLRPQPGSQGNKFLSYFERLEDSAVAKMFPNKAKFKQAKPSKPPRPLIRQAAAQRPGSFASSELAMGTSAGVGFSTAQEVFPDQPLVQVLAGLGGGFLNPIRAVPKVVNTSTDFLRENILPILGGAENVAAGELQAALRAAGEDPEKLLKVLMDHKTQGVEGAKLSPAQSTESKVLLSLEKAVIQSTAAVAGSFEEAAAVTAAAIRQAADNMGDPTTFSTREILEGKIAHLKTLMDDRLANAIEIAVKRTESLDPGAPRSEIGRTARVELDNALGDVLDQQKALWERVDLDTPSGTASSHESYTEIMGRGAVHDDPKNIPDYIHQTFSGDKGPLQLGETTTLKELKSLRTRLLEDIRSEGAKPDGNRKKIGIMNKMQRALLDDMGGTVADSSELAVAMAFSREMNETFFSGPVGKILANDVHGAERIAYESTLDVMLSPRGIRPKLNAEAILKATKSSPEMRAAMVDDIKSQFILAAVRGESVNSKTAETFIRNNDELLDIFPELKHELRMAIKDQNYKAMIERSNKTWGKNILDRNKSRAQVWLNEKPGREAKKALGSKDPVADIEQLIKQMDGDPSGIAGLKGAFVSEMLAKAELKSIDASGKRIIRGQTLADEFSKSKSIFQQSGLFSFEELSFLQRIVDTGRKVDARLLHGESLDDILHDAPSQMIEFAASAMGAKISTGLLGGGNAGTSIMIAGRGARAGRTIVGKLSLGRKRAILTEAVQDREVMKLLLEKAVTIERKAAIAKSLDAWLVNLLSKEELEGMEE